MFPTEDSLSYMIVETEDIAQYAQNQPRTLPQSITVEMERPETSQVVDGNTGVWVRLKEMVSEWELVHSCEQKVGKQSDDASSGYCTSCCCSGWLSPPTAQDVATSSTSSSGALQFLRSRKGLLGGRMPQLATKFVLAR